MLELLQSKWDDILHFMEKEYFISPITMRSWIYPLKIYSVENGIVNLYVNDANPEMFCKVVSKKYATCLKVSISEVMNQEFEVNFLTSFPNKQSNSTSNSLSSSSDINEESINNRIIEAGLSSKFTFDTFVVGENNRYAHSASLAVAEDPGEIYNPLFIYGGVGLGKTHLMKAIGYYIIMNNPSAKVMYVTSEQFTNEIIDLVRNDRNSMNRFRDKYRKVDVLMIDDIQFIIGKEMTQEEFFHTFNTLRDLGKQVIITSDRAPKKFESLDERFKSRFENGITVDISQPNYETRMAILRKKKENIGCDINDEILEYIAANVKSNVRELEGSLNKLVLYCTKLSHQDITLEIAEEQLADLISPDAHQKITPELIIKVVADHFHISTEDILSQRRNKEIVLPRHVVMYLCRNLTDIPLKKIGNYIGKKDHTSVSYGIDNITVKIKTDEELLNDINTITKKLNPS